MHYQPVRPLPRPAREQRKLALLFKRGGATQHCAGVNALALDGDVLYTASRDATLKRWEPSGEAGQGLACTASLEGHADWVNDVALVGGALVSASTDRTVRLWSPAEGTCTATLLGHSDYVLAIAAAPEVARFASGGLRGEVFLWDLATAAKLQAQQAPGDPLRRHKGSAYALALSGDARLVVAGSVEGKIRLTDARTGAKAMKLLGHSDNVRALALSEDGRLLVSGSSDKTLRVWDLAQQRCIQTEAPHVDSVWALAPLGDFTHILSGGRDGCVYRTNLVARTSALLLQQDAPVQGLAVAQDGHGVWVATTDSTVSQWRLGAWPHGASENAAGAGGGSTAASAPNGTTPPAQPQPEASATSQPDRAVLGKSAVGQPAAEQGPGLAAQPSTPSRQQAEEPLEPDARQREQEQQGAAGSAAGAAAAQDPHGAHTAASRGSSAPGGPQRDRSLPRVSTGGSSDNYYDPSGEVEGDAAPGSELHPGAAGSTPEPLPHPQGASAAPEAAASHPQSKPAQGGQARQLAAPDAAEGPPEAIPPRGPGRPLRGALQDWALEEHSMGTSAAARSQKAFPTGAHPRPALQAPASSLRGLPALTAAAVLPGRRLILVRDAAGCVELWDVLAARIVESFGQVELAAAERRLFRPEHVPAWYSADVRLGALTLTLEAGSAFAAETYLEALGFSEGCGDDAKVNCGLYLLQGALRHWAAAFVEGDRRQGNEVGSLDTVQGTELLNPLGLREHITVCGELPLDPRTQARTSVVKAHTALGLGDQPPSGMLPLWACEALALNRLPAPDKLKRSFHLLPAQGSELPPLQQSKLTAPNILPMRKAYQYVCTRLAEQLPQLELQPRAAHWSPQAGEGEGPEEADPAEAGAPPQLELLCGGALVPLDLTLAATWHHMWRRPDELRLAYQLANPRRPAPLPDIRPPAASS